MASEVSVVNVALVRLGVATISAMTDDSPQARVANRVFDEVRDELLRDHTWGWATTRVSIASSTTAPVWEFARAFPLPADYMRLVDIENTSKLEYRIERTSDGRVIVTDLGSPLKIAYIARVTDPEQWDPKFRTAMSARFAMDWNEPLTSGAADGKALASEYVVSLREAKAVEGQEDSVRQISVDSWIDSRF